MYDSYHEMAHNYVSRSEYYIPSNYYVNFDSFQYIPRGIFITRLNVLACMCFDKYCGGLRKLLDFD